jgi:hypothetical protein
MGPLFLRLASGDSLDFSARIRRVAPRAVWDEQAERSEQSLRFDGTQALDPMGDLVSTRIGILCRMHPRGSAAIIFGATTALVAYFAWIPSARASSGTMYLSVAAGLAHAVAGAIRAPRLVDPARTPNDAIALRGGAITSLLALLFFSIGFSTYLLLTGGWTLTLAAVFVLPLYTAFFAFFALGWAMLGISALLAWGIHRVVTTSSGKAIDA